MTESDPFSVGMPVDLEQLADQLDAQFGEETWYLDRRTGKLCYIPEDFGISFGFSDPEEVDETYSEDDQEAAAEFLMIMNDTEGRFVELPDRFEVDAWGTMAAFSEGYPDEKISRRLCDAIQGKGAFGRFKDLVQHYEIDKEWQEFETEKNLDLARDWCKQNNIPFLPPSRKG